MSLALFAACFYGEEVYLHIYIYIQTELKCLMSLKGNLVAMASNLIVSQKDCRNVVTEGTGTFLDVSCSCSNWPQEALKPSSLFACRSPLDSSGVW